MVEYGRSSSPTTGKGDSHARNGNTYDTQKNVNEKRARDIVDDLKFPLSAVELYNPSKKTKL